MKPNGQQTMSRRDLEGRVMESFRNSGRPELRRLRIDIQEGDVVLRGQVSTYYAKQLAQTLAGQVCGIGSLHNDIQVNRKGTPLAARRDNRFHEAVDAAYTG